MRITVSPSVVSGILSANPSKSHAQRAIAIAALAKGTSLLEGIGTSEDVQHALNITEAIGAKISHENNSVRITGAQTLHQNRWPCGESGLALRMFSAIAALYDTTITLTAEGTLTSRPIDFLEKSLAQLGVEFSSLHGFPPAQITGPFRFSHAIIDGSVSSQFLTGLLIAMPLVQHDTTLDVLNLKSKPYIDLTLATMHDFGVHVEHDNYTSFHITGKQQYRATDLAIQGDWSGMAFLLIAAAFTGSISVTGLPSPDTQADGRILEALKRCGVHIEINHDKVVVRHADLHAFEFDCTHCPDLFPPLVALAAHCNGTSKIKGIHRLKSKESDRGVALITEFSKLGVHTWQDEDRLYVEGGIVRGSDVVSHGDHRIAMALATTALKALEPVTISGAECIAKSYPDFFKDLQSLGAEIQFHS